MPPILKILKYRNRKLYSDRASSYLSTLDLAALVADGETVIVIDDCNQKKDITFETLSRALYERVRWFMDVSEKRPIPPDPFPREKLCELIRMIPSKRPRR
jgi:hypothetical protein